MTRYGSYLVGAERGEPVWEKTEIRRVWTWPRRSVSQLLTVGSNHDETCNRVVYVGSCLFGMLIVAVTPRLRSHTCKSCVKEFYANWPDDREGR